MPVLKLCSVMILIFACFCSSRCSESNANHVTTFFCVTTDNATKRDSVCHNSTFAKTDTLLHFMNHSSTYFKSYKTFIFEAGEHHPLGNFNLTVRHVKNLTLQGPERNSSSQAAAVINCNGQSNMFWFTNSSHILIKDLTFFACSVSHPTGKADHGLSTLVFNKVFHLSLLRIKVFSSADEALYIGNVFGEVIIDGLEVANSTTNGKAIPRAGNRIKYEHCHNKQSARVKITHSKFTSNTNFVKKIATNIYAAGLIVELYCPNIKVYISYLKFVDNTGYVGGNMAVLFGSTQPGYNTTSVEIENSLFEGGHASKGGGMYVQFIEKQHRCTGKNIHQDNFHLYIHNSNFTNNSAEYAGAGVYLVQKQSLTLCNPKIIKFENVNFISNIVEKVGFGGIAVHSIDFVVTDYLNHLYPQYKVIMRYCSIHDNYVKDYSLTRDGSGTGAIFTKSNNYFQIKNTTVFNNNVTGILGMSSNIILSGNITITNNTGSSGGGLLLCQNAVMYLDDHTNVTITNNHAIHTGGGICVETNHLQSKPICFFQLTISPLTNRKLIKTVNVSIYNNHADFAGHNIFGGSIEYCFIIDSPKHHSYGSKDIYNAVFYVPKNKDRTSSVTSPPHHICFCVYNKHRPNCWVRIHRVEPIFPGETISVHAVLVGQYGGIVPGTVEAHLQHPRYSQLARYEDVQNLKNVSSCTKLQYTIYTDQSHEMLTFNVEQLGDISGFTQENWQYKKYKVKISLKTCPMGFALIHDNVAYCGCSSLLRRHKVSCYIRNQTILRSPPEWIGYIERENGTKEVAFHKYCPFDYCSDKATFLNVTESSINQDKQCASHRSGILCGSCQRGFSLVSAGSECCQCSNYWLMMYVLYALLGIVTLLVFTIINFTISEGTLSGIIFYCNILKSNFSVFFHGRGVPYLTPMLKFFIYLANLEPGVSHCLYNGMDAYARAWISFVFPFYIWFIAGVLIWLGGRYSWIVRRNAVKVLATLILLSYTRLLDSIAEALQVRSIEIQSEGREKRWLIDGNIQYFKGKHTFLVIFAALLSFILCPFTLSLIFIQQVQSVSHYKGLRWINKFKPFIDAYTGPFTSRAQCWTGLLLLARGIICVVSAVNTVGDSKVILGTISLSVFVLVIFTSLLPNGLYRRRWLNTLECLSLLNLGVLATLLYIFTDEEIMSIVVTHVCVIIALMILFGIIAYHIVTLKLIKTLLNRYCCYESIQQYLTRANANARAVEATDIDTDTFPRYQPFNEEREPLLGTDSDELEN